MGQLLPLDTSVCAEYEDGYILDETEHDDTSPYTGVHNIFNDILEKRPESEHGRMVRFSCFYKNNRYDVDWRLLPDNARPIRFRDGYVQRNLSTGEETRGYSACRFGYQFTDENGKNQKVIKEL